MKEHGIFTVLMVLVVMATSVGASHAQYLPLEPGSSQYYANIGNPYYRIHRYVTELGSLAVYRSDVLVGDEITETLAVRLSRDSFGDIYCHGGCWCPGQDPCKLTPGDLMLPGRMQVGDSWQSRCESSVHGPITFAYFCVRSETLTVPAGTFECLLVTRHIKASTWKFRSIEWYSPGVGIVKFYWPWAGTYELTEMSNEIQPHNEKGFDSDTWGGVKALYK
jgi:hypothetical protein